MTGKPEILVTWLILNCWRTVFKQHVLFAMISVKGKTSIDAMRLLRSQVPNFLTILQNITKQTHRICLCYRHYMKFTEWSLIQHGNKAGEFAEMVFYRLTLAPPDAWITWRHVLLPSTFTRCVWWCMQTKKENALIKAVISVDVLLPKIKHKTVLLNKDEIDK